MKDSELALVCAGQSLCLAVLEAGLCASPFLLDALGARGDGALAAWSGAGQAAAGACAVLSIPFWGRLADRTGRVRMLARAQAGLAASLVLLSAAA
jgi:MFS family permease